MHIIYVDESGTPALEPNSKHFVIAGLAMPLRAWKARARNSRGLRKNYAKTAAYIHLTHAERVTALRSVADALAGWEDARLFGDAHLKSALSTEQRARSREFALEQITSRFNTYLANVQGPDALGIMVHDQHQAESLKLTSLFRRWHEGGTAFTAIPHLAETPLFVENAVRLSRLSGSRALTLPHRGRSQRPTR
jgi:hypothetical protein